MAEQDLIKIEIATLRAVIVTILCRRDVMAGRPASGRAAGVNVPLASYLERL